MTTTDDKPPHSYKDQRLLERRADATRKGMLKNGVSKLPPVCGFTYTTRRNRNKPDVPTYIAVCARTAGSNTKHQGRGYCDYHDWQAAHDNENNTGQKQLGAALKVANERANFFGKQTAIDPHTALLDEISRTASVVKWLNDQMQELRDQGMTDHDIMMQKTFQAGFRPSVWMELYQQERDHLVKTCIAAIKAGVAERKVQIAERQGQLIASMMFAFIHDMDLGLSPQQIMDAPRLIRKHLMALPMMGTDPEKTIDPAGVMRSTHPHGKDIIDVPSREAM